MQRVKFDQIQYEVDLSKRKLDIRFEENFYQKNKLIEILRNEFDKRLLYAAEDFHTRFLQEDELIGILKSELKALNKLFVCEIFEGELMAKEIVCLLKKLRNEIASTEIKFTKLKFEFDNYLLENCLMDDF